MRWGLLALVGIACSHETPNAPDASDGSCVQSTAVLTESPSVILFLLQRSGSMAKDGKWAFAAQAITSAIDLPVFDTMGVGLIAAPSMNVTGPMCVANFEVACGVSFAQVPPRFAGSKKSSDSAGVRHDMKAWLDANAPDQNVGDGNPLYAAIRAGTTTLQTLDVAGARLLFVVTDGQVSCTSLSNRPGFTDINGCPDWENPNNVIDLVKTGLADPRAPVQTFIVGVPGADTYDPTGKTAPPYRMRAALSAIAKAGAPSFVPQGCDAMIPFDVMAPDPQASCHFDMTKAYSASAVSDAISRVRSTAKSCIFTLPAQSPIDPGKVNVMLGAKPIHRRYDAKSPCAEGCWDYTASNAVELFGPACDAVTKGEKVSATIGCPTDVR